MMYKNISNYKVEDDYPYGKFPIEYTKYGKEELKRQLEQASKQDAIQSVQTMNTSPAPQYTNNTPSMDIKMLLPLLKAMNSKGKVGTGELMKAMLPMLGGDNKNMGDIIGAFEGLASKPTKHTSKIESYTRVDNINEDKK